MKKLIHGVKVKVEGRYEVAFNGRRYVVITLKNGDTKVYPQGRPPTTSPKFQLSKHETLFAPRVNDQLPHIHANLWAVVDTTGDLVGNVFALDSRRFLTPHHVAWYMENNDFVLVRDDERRAYNAGASISVLRHPNPEVDFAMVSFTSSTIAHGGFIKIRDVFSYLASEVASTGSAAHCLRLANGEILMTPCTFSTPANRVWYEYGPQKYRSPVHTTRIIQGFQSKVGYCGGIYITRSSVSTQSVLGFHLPLEMTEVIFLHSLLIGSLLFDLMLFLIPSLLFPVKLLRVLYLLLWVSYPEKLLCSCLLVRVASKSLFLYLQVLSVLMSLRLSLSFPCLEI